MARRAQCGCGSLTAEVLAEPQGVGICHCVECQRRTGAPFGEAAFFLAADVVISGASTAYSRAGASGGRVESPFCPTCGSTVYWAPEKFPGLVAIAVGAFADPAFPPPGISAWEQSRHPWLDFSNTMRRLPRGA